MGVYVVDVADGVRGIRLFVEADSAAEARKVGRVAFMARYGTWVGTKASAKADPNISLSGKGVR
jgi:hypothetical protein